MLKYIFQKLITDDRAVSNFVEEKDFNLTERESKNSNTNKFLIVQFAKPFMNIDYPRGSVVNTMDLSTMEKKIEIGAYSCCEDFWADIKWIVHNTKIHCTGDSRFYPISFEKTFEWALSIDLIFHELLTQYEKMWG